MKYYRCKCGHKTAWSSMGIYLCTTCDDCYSTLGENPDDHPDSIPHDLVSEKNILTNSLGTIIKTKKYCNRCHKIFINEERKL